MIFGVATALGFCRGGNLGQCAAHYIMGSAFIGYAAILVIMLNLGGKWLQRTGYSQEMLDSSVIMVWVCHHDSRMKPELKDDQGYLQHIYRTSWRSLVAQGYATYNDGGLGLTMIQDAMN